MTKLRQAPGELERVRRFVNTREVGHVTDRLTDPAALIAWLEREGLAPAGTRGTRADLARAIELREALRAILLAHNGPGSGAGAAPAVPGALTGRSTRPVREHACACASATTGAPRWRPMPPG